MHTHLDDALRRRLDDRVARIVDLHFDPKHGSRFWLRRAERKGLDARRLVRSVDDLAMLGSMSQADLAGQRLDDLVPRSVMIDPARLVIGQTGGTSGRPVWTAYRNDEFDAAFVEPFVTAAAFVGVPRGLRWLFVGPTGPHVIGKAMRSLARALESMEPYSVDFDPRWFRKLAPGSFAAGRYLAHVTEQARTIVAEQGVTALFATPSALSALAALMTDAERDRIAAVHYGGVSMTPDEMLRFQTDIFPNAVHVSGYGNTLFGCCLELSPAVGRELDFFPHGDRLLLDTVDASGQPVGPDQPGRVRFTRLDDSMLIVGMVERDVGVSIGPPLSSPPGFDLPGIRNPAPSTRCEVAAVGHVTTLY